MNSPRPQQRHGSDARSSARRTASALYQSIDTSPGGAQAVTQAARHGIARADQLPSASPIPDNYLPNWSFSRLDAPRDAPRAAGTWTGPAPYDSASDFGFGGKGGSTGTSHNNTSSMAPHPSTGHFNTVGAGGGAAQGGAGGRGGIGSRVGPEVVVLPAQWQGGARRGDGGDAGISAVGRARQQLPWMEDSQQIQDIFQAAAQAAASVVSTPTVTPTPPHLHNVSAVSIPTVARTGAGSFANMNARSIAAPLDSDSEYEPQTLDDRSIGERLQGVRRNRIRLHPALHASHLADTDTVTIERGSEAASNYNTANYNTAADALTDDGSDDQDNSIATLGKNSQNYSVS
jgi:hypothetical protein